MVAFAKKSVMRPRCERLALRVTPDKKLLIQRAAGLEGRSVADFVVATVHEAARRTAEARATIALYAAESRAFVEAMLNPPPVDARLRETVRRY